MKFLDRAECIDWSRRQGFALAEAGTPDPPSRYSNQANPSLKIRENLSSLSGTAVAVSEALGISRPTLLWITKTDVVASRENWHLYYQIRRALGDRRLLGEAPGHLVGDTDGDVLSVLLLLCMTFTWCAHVMARSGEHAFIGCGITPTIEMNFSDIRHHE
jgi:hypothetical protein